MARPKHILIVARLAGTKSRPRAEGLGSRDLLASVLYFAAPT